jgi:hypothetical protein
MSGEGGETERFGEKLDNRFRANAVAGVAGCGRHATARQRSPPVPTGVSPEAWHPFDINNSKQESWLTCAVLLQRHTLQQDT